MSLHLSLDSGVSFRRLYVFRNLPHMNQWYIFFQVIWKETMFLKVTYCTIMYIVIIFGHDNNEDEVAQCIAIILGVIT
jgi:hypothetical protein